MKKIVLALFSGILLFTLQSTLFTLSPFNQFRPDLILIFILLLGLFYPPLSGGLIAFFLGYGMDLFSGNMFGLYTLSRPILFFLAQSFKNHLYLERSIFQSLFVFLFSWVEGLLILLLLQILNPGSWEALLSLLPSIYLPQSLSTALVAPFFFRFRRRRSLYLVSEPNLGSGEGRS